MKFAARTSVLLFAILLSMACIRANGPGGGHGGSGGHAAGGHASGGHGNGHGGGHAGYSAAHLSSGNSSAHSFHAFTHVFHHGPRHRAFRQPVAFFPRRRHFGSFGCNDVFFPRLRSGFNCFNNGFFLDPFFFGAFSMLGPVPDTISASLLPDPGASNEMSAPPDNEPLSDGIPQGERTVTLLQLLDGSMYGLTTYRVVGHDLHYTTTYGGQNSVPLDRIDFTQTLKLNADRHVPFILEPKSAPH